MEKIHILFKKLIDMMFWRTLMSQFHWVDWLTVAFLLIGLIYGARKGLMREAVEFLEMVMILIVTYIFQPMVVSVSINYLPLLSERSVAPAAFILTALCAWFVIAVIDKQLQKWVHAKLSGFFKVTGGALIGLAHFFLIWSFLSQAVLLMPVRGAQKIYDPGNSVTGLYVKTIAPDIYTAISNPEKFFSKKAK